MVELIVKLPLPVMLDSDIINVLFCHFQFAMMTYRLQEDLAHGLPFRLQSNINDTAQTRY